jgi:glycosyltransferase involved in cell wall biosynthesis
MRFGFDAKRAFHNKTGLGNYSRDSIRLLSELYPNNEYFLYNPKKGDISFNVDRSNTREVFPEGRLNKITSSYWRQKPIVKQLIKDKVNVFIGLSNELPSSIDKSPVKSIVIIHDLIFIRFPELYSKIDQKIHVKKVKRACKVADKIIAISEQTKNDIVDFLKVEPNKIEVVYQGCHPVFQKKYDLDLQKSVKNKFNLPEKFILNVGTIEKRKGLLTAVQAISDFPEIHLVVVGKQTKYTETVKEFIDKFNMQDRVHFLKNVSMPELASIYQLANLFVYPSIFEGFGIPIIEALFSKTPVISSTGSCFSEAGGEYSWYVEPGNSSELKLAILELWNNPETCDEMTNRGFDFVQKFKDENVAKNLFEAINI